jgi:two-component system response regulator (stage 0 sporulation protein F)
MFKNVLLADSDIDSRNRLYEILFSVGHRVVCAPNANEALARLQTERPNLVILDENLPPEGGLKTLEKIRGFDRQIKVVFLSREELGVELETKMRRLGVSALIKKDYSTHTMFKKILEILGEAEEKIPEDKYLSFGRIFVVDDNPEMRTLLTTFLRMKGFDVKECASGDQALMEINLQKPKLILLDERMTGMDGLMALKKIKEFDRAIKVVMLTAVEDEDIIGKAKELGALDYITKPCDLAKLEAMVLSMMIPENMDKLKNPK